VVFVATVMSVVVVDTHTRVIRVEG
jgi:hypothetical protein